MSDGIVITAGPAPEAEDLLKRFIDLAQPRLGTEAVETTDDFFAPMARIISPEPPVFMPDKYDDNGKWMDGWESRRKRGPGHDWCILKLGQPGRIGAVDIDTSFFTGNNAPAASLEARASGSQEWVELIPQTKLNPNSHHILPVADQRTWSELRLNIYPDGGVARLRVYGEIDKDWTDVGVEDEVDLVAMLNGGKGVAWNDAHYGLPANIIAPGPGVNMGDGWETARRRGPGNDWCVLQLGHSGRIERAVVDTAFFKGNYPESCTLRAGSLPGGASAEEIERLSEAWPEILPAQKLSADTGHEFASELTSHEPATHVRLDIFPDGGISRLRLFGKISR